MVSTLAQLFSLHSLSVLFFWGFHWDTPPDNLQSWQSTLSSLLQNGLLVSVTIHNVCDFPTSIFCSCPQLRDLHVDNMTPSELSDTAYMPSTSLPHLHKGQLATLNFIRGGAFTQSLLKSLGHPQSALGIDHLRVLEVRITDNADFEGCRKVLEMSAHTIEEFTFNLLLEEFSMYLASSHFDELE
jgi:hypothetical protein